MGTNEQDYNVVAIHELLMNAFTADDLRRFFLYTTNPKLRQMRVRFGRGDGLVDMVEKVIEYCETNTLFPDLLQEVERANPRRYAMHGPYVAKVPAKPEPEQASTAPPHVPPLPPSQEHLLEIQVFTERVTLRFGGKVYESPNRINPQALKNLEEIAPREYGELLFQGILHDEPTPGSSRHYATLRGYDSAVKESGRRLRIELRLADEELHQFWWEYLKDPDSDVPLAVYEHSPLYRRLRGNEDVVPVQARPLRILAAICNPTTLGQPGNRFLAGLNPLDVDQERAILEQGLEQLAQNGLATYQILDSATGEAVTLDALRKALQEGFHVLHILAHGVVLDDGEFCLVMESEDRGHELVPASRFKTPVLGQQLRLVVLAACQSADFRGGQALQGLGPRLVKLGVPAVIAMQKQVSLETARLFAQCFYDDLARSGCIDMAMADTRFDLYWHREGSWSWGVPVLLMGTSNGQLFEVAAK
ncbi:MAG TPA: CHAT domain-containing protein [Anaerolineae bacterium]|nr:CHAT domain-containing protein [Anaerolineae bacterium]